MYMLQVSIEELNSFQYLIQLDNEILLTNPIFFFLNISKRGSLYCEIILNQGDHCSGLSYFCFVGMLFHG